MKRTVILLAGVAYGGCDAEGGGVSAATASAGAEMRRRIEALDPSQRDALFLRAVRDAGRDCQRVLGSAYNGLQFGMPSWAARCSDGADWLVMLRDDGTALVARREEKPGKPGHP